MKRWRVALLVLLWAAIAPGFVSIVEARPQTPSRPKPPEPPIPGKNSLLTVGPEATPDGQRQWQIQLPAQHVLHLRLEQLDTDVAIELQNLCGNTKANCLKPPRKTL